MARRWPIRPLHLRPCEVEFVLTDLRQLVHGARATADKARSCKGQGKAHAPPQLPIPDHIELRILLGWLKSTAIWFAAIVLPLTAPAKKLTRADARCVRVGREERVRS